MGPVPARSGNGHGAYGRPGAEPDTDPKEVEHENSRELSAVLERGLLDHAYEHLVVVAPPQLLGTLRRTVTHQVEKKLEVTIDKDLTGIPSVISRSASKLPSTFEWEGRSRPSPSLRPGPPIQTFRRYATLAPTSCGVSGKGDPAEFLASGSPRVAPRLHGASGQPSCSTVPVVKESES